MANQNKKNNTNKRIIFAHSYWDILPTLAGITHFAYLIAMFILFPQFS